MVRMIVFDSTTRTTSITMTVGIGLGRSGIGTELKQSVLL